MHRVAGCVVLPRMQSLVDACCCGKHHFDRLSSDPDRLGMDWMFHALVNVATFG
jgi:hypothetical protein